MYRKSMQEWRYPLGLLAAYGVIWFALAIDPVFRKDWLLENAIVFVAIPLFVLTARRLRFSNFAYTCLFLFFVFHADRRALHVFARAIRRLVAVDRRRRSRGAQSLRPHRAFSLRLAGDAGRGRDLRALRKLRAAAGPSCCPGCSWPATRSSMRLIEFAAALVFGGELGQAYLGMQGDIWDAQKDMALALLGTTIMLAALAAAGRLPGRRAGLKGTLSSRGCVLFNGERPVRMSG